jgi:hypothetical protein
LDFGATRRFDPALVEAFRTLLKRLNAIVSIPELIATRKYHLLSECDRVCLVVDNRPQYYKERVDPRARYRRAP